MEGISPFVFFHFDLSLALFISSFIATLLSFLDKYIDKSIVSPKVTNSIYDFSNAINTPLYENNDYLNDFYIIIDHLQELKQNSIIWRKNLIKNNSLCLNLIKFAQLIEK